MLLSILISLTPLADAPILGGLGRPANAWFLGQVAQANPGLASRLHDRPGLKPYTVSSLLNDRGLPLRAGEWVRRGQEVWLRATTMEARLSEALLSEALPRLAPSAELYKMRFRVEGWTDNRFQHPWAGSSSFDELAGQEGHNPHKGIRMEFASPTGFHSRVSETPLPLPGAVFRSLMEKWNAFAPPAACIRPEWSAFAEANIQVEELTDINTTRWVFAEGTRGAALGFTGAAGFRLRPLRHSAGWEAQWEGAAPVMALLAQFAFYSGVGHHTTIGMGQARPLPPSGASRRTSHPDSTH